MSLRTYSHQLAALDAKAVKAWLQDASWKGRANKNNPRFYADVPADDSGPFAAIRKAIIDAINKAERKKRQKVGGTGKTGKTGRIHLKMKGEEEMAYEYEAAYSMDAATGSSPNKHRVAPVAAPTCVLVASVYGGALTPAAAAKAIEAASTVPPQRFSLKAVKVEPTGLKATTKANIGNTFALGIKHTAATKAKMSAAQKGKKGKKRTAATKAKMSAAQKGKKHTAATKAKMSAARKGKKHTAASKAKMSAAQKGKKRTAATKAKMSAAQNRRRLRESRA